MEPGDRAPDGDVAAFVERVKAEDRGLLDRLAAGDVRDGDDAEAWQRPERVSVDVVPLTEFELGQYRTALAEVLAKPEELAETMTEGPALLLRALITALVDGEPRDEELAPIEDRLLFEIVTAAIDSQPWLRGTVRVMVPPSVYRRVRSAYGVPGDPLAVFPGELPGLARPQLRSRLPVPDEGVAAYLLYPNEGDPLAEPGWEGWSRPGRQFLRRPAGLLGAVAEEMADAALGQWAYQEYTESGEAPIPLDRAGLTDELIEYLDGVTVEDGKLMKSAWRPTTSDESGQA